MKSKNSRMGFTSIMASMALAILALACSRSLGANNASNEDPCVSVARENLIRDPHHRLEEIRRGACCSALSAIAGEGSKMVVGTVAGTTVISEDLNAESVKKAAQRLCDALLVPVRVDLEKLYVEYEFEQVAKACGLEYDIKFGSTTCAISTPKP